MKKSKIKRLTPKKVARQLAESSRNEEAFRTQLAQAGADTIARMLEKGYELVTCLESGEGVFVREVEVVGLHIQLSIELYNKLDQACRSRETTKRNIVVAALERYLE